MCEKCLTNDSSLFGEGVTLKLRALKSLAIGRSSQEPSLLPLRLSLVQRELPRHDRRSPMRALLLAAFLSSTALVASAGAANPAHRTPNVIPQGRGSGPRIGERMRTSGRFLSASRSNPMRASPPTRPSHGSRRAMQSLPRHPRADQTGCRGRPRAEPGSSRSRRRLRKRPQAAQRASRSRPPRHPRPRRRPRSWSSRFSRASPSDSCGPR